MNKFNVEGKARMIKLKDEWVPLGTTSDIEINTRTGEQRRIIYF